MAIEPRDVQSTGRADEPSDRDLVRAAKSGNRDAFDRLCRRYYRRVRSLCFLIVRDEARAQDLTQEVFLRALTRLHRFDTTLEVWPWLVTIARRICIDDLRKHARRYAVALAASDRDELTTPSAQDEAFDRQASADLARELRDALGTLRKRERTLFLRRYVEGWSYERLAADEETSVNAVRNVVWRARASLRAALSRSPGRAGRPSVLLGAVALWRRTVARARSRALEALPAGAGGLGSAFGALTVVLLVSVPSTHPSNAPATRRPGPQVSTPADASPQTAPSRRAGSSAEPSTPRSGAPLRMGVKMAPAKPRHGAPSRATVRIEVVGPDGEVIYWWQTDVECGGQAARVLPSEGPIRAIC